VELLPAFGVDLLRDLIFLAFRPARFPLTFYSDSAKCGVPGLFSFFSLLLFKYVGVAVVSEATPFPGGSAFRVATGLLTSLLYSLLFLLFLLVSLQILPDVLMDFTNGALWEADPRFFDRAVEGTPPLELVSRSSIARPAPLLLFP